MSASFFLDLPLLALSSLSHVQRALGQFGGVKPQLRTHHSSSVPTAPLAATQSSGSAPSERADAAAAPSHHSSLSESHLRSCVGISTPGAALVSPSCKPIPPPLADAPLPFLLGAFFFVPSPSLAACKLRQALKPSSHVGEPSSVGVAEHVPSHAPPFEQQFGTSGDAAGKPHLGQRLVEFVVRSAPSASRAGSLAWTLAAFGAFVPSLVACSCLACSLAALLAETSLVTVSTMSEKSALAVGGLAVALSVLAVALSWLAVALSSVCGLSALITLTAVLVPSSSVTPPIC